MSMRSPLRGRAARLAAATALVFAAMLPGAAAPAAAADPVILRVGTTQDLDASNRSTRRWSWATRSSADYQLLVDFDKDAKPAPGFSDTWQRSADRVTFHIPDGMKFSRWHPGDVGRRVLLVGPRDGRDQETTRTSATAT
jgi:hypothetical protein